MQRLRNILSNLTFPQIFSLVLLAIISVQGLISLDRKSYVQEINPGYREEQAAQIKAYEAQFLDNSTDPDIAYKLADLYYESGEYEKSIHVFETGLKANPENVRLIMRLAHVYRYVGRYEDAEKQFLLAINLKPNDAWGYVDLAKLYRNWRKYDEGEKMLQKAIAIDPKNDRIYSYGLGYIYRDEGDLEKALPMFQKAFELNPDAFNHKALGDIYRDLKRYEEAEALFRQAIQIDPRSEAYQSLGLLYLETGDIDHAIEAFNNFLLLIRPKSDIYNGLALAYLRKGDLNESREYYDLSISLNPRGGGYEGLGNLEAREGNLPGAIQAIKSELKANPENQRAKEKLAELERENAGLR